MTPLFHRIAKELTLPKSKRRFQDGCGVLSNLGDVHSFEVTEVFELAVSLAQETVSTMQRTGRLELMAVQSFLPAPRTWIERIDDEGTREAFLLIQNADGISARVLTAVDTAQGDFGAFPFGDSVFDKPNGLE